MRNFKIHPVVPVVAATMLAGCGGPGQAGATGATSAPPIAATPAMSAVTVADLEAAATRVKTIVGADEVDDQTARAWVKSICSLHANGKSDAEIGKLFAVELPKGSADKVTDVVTVARQGVCR